jgi:peptidoglycan/xylan/chitin deacetylase (PgdA/CDA1 family)
MQVWAVVQGLEAERAALARYVLRTFLRTLGLPHTIAEEPPDDLTGVVLLWYGTSPPPADARALVEIACLDPPGPDTPVAWARIRVGDERVAFLGGHRAVEGIMCYAAEADEQAVLAYEGHHWRFGFDLVASAGFWLTGGEETPDRLDALGRARGTVGPRHDAFLTDTPVVNDLMRLLRECLEWAADRIRQPWVRLTPWPAVYTGAVLLTHDVDLWRKRSLRRLAKELLRSLAAPRRLGSALRAFLSGPDPWALEPIADLEDAYGARSTFFLLPGRPDRTVSGIHVVNGYPVPREAVAAVARRLTERGFEVALHGSFTSPVTAEGLTEEGRTVGQLSGQPVAGVRQHFLYFERPGTWLAQAEAGFLYDATLGYRDATGYRAGFSLPFYPFVDGRELPLVELPLVVMDGVLWNERKLDAAHAWAVIERHLRRVQVEGGLLSLLWHNTHFCDLDAPGYRWLYERVLQSVRGFWTPTARELAEWWRRRSAALLSVEHLGSRTRIGIASTESVADLCLEVRAPSESVKRDQVHRVSREGCQVENLGALGGTAAVKLVELHGGTGTIEIHWE